MMSTEKNKTYARIISAVLCAAAALTLGGCREISEEPVESPASSTVISPENTEGEFVSPVYELLSEEEKELYDRIYSAVENFEESVAFDEPVPRDVLNKIYRLVYAQERNFFWLSNVFYAPEKEISVYKLSYLFTRDASNAMRAELDLAAEEILSVLPEDASAFDKLAHFHDTIVRGCKFSQTAVNSKSAYGVLVDGLGQCEGYAAAMSFLCGKAGIPNYMVTGTDEDGATHAWNKVLLYGEWYNIDCTWDDPILNKGSEDFVRHDYMLVTDEEIEGVTHFTDDRYSGVPPCTSSEGNYFYQKGIVYATAAEAVSAMKEQVRTTGLAGKREVELRMSDENEYFAALARLIDNGEMKSIIEDINGEYGTRIRSAYRHNNDRLHIIHLSLIYESDKQE
ncbi:MAG: hypothetical protein NC253_08000 [Ruminococcus sp.]|nr:hypothetical protein [Ruminococcus sp.]MCM1478173.1 hypothetical protein [Muribaculaceae bacterium]